MNIFNLENIEHWIKDSIFYREKMEEMSNLKTQTFKDFFMKEERSLKFYRSISTLELNKGYDTFVDLLLLCIEICFIKYISFSNRKRDNQLLPAFAIYELFYFNDSEIFEKIRMRIIQRGKTVNAETKIYYVKALNFFDKYINNGRLFLLNKNSILQMDIENGIVDLNLHITLKNSELFNIDLEDNNLNISTLGTSFETFMIPTEYEILLDHMKRMEEYSHENITFLNINNEMHLTINNKFSSFMLIVTKYNKPI